MHNYYKKKTSDPQERIYFVYQIVKAAVRVLLVLVLLHRCFWTSFEDYGEVISKKTENIQDIKEIEQKLYDHDELKVPAKAEIDEKVFSSSIALKDVKPEEVAEKREEVREKTKEDIRKNLKDSEKGAVYSKLNLKYDPNNKKWRERTKWESFTSDPQRFLFIQPLQFFSKKVGIESSKNALVLDILVKVIIFRLILNWISYPQEQGMPNFGEENEKLQNPYLTLEERERINKKMRNQLKHIFFNLGMIVLFLLCISLHPFSFNKADSLYMKKTEIYWFIPYLIISVFSHLSTSYLWQKLPFREFLRKNILSSIAWSAFPLLFFYFFAPNKSGTMMEFGGYLYFLFGEAINFLINLVKIFFINYKKNRNQTKFS